MDQNNQSTNTPRTQPIPPTDNRPVIDVSAEDPRPISPQQPSPASQPKTMQVVFEDDLVMTITSDTVNDMRFMELYDLVNEDYMKLPKLLRFMFGDEEYESIFTYYESRGQKFTMTKMESVFEKFNNEMNTNPDFLRG